MKISLLRLVRLLELETPPSHPPRVFASGTLRALALTAEQRVALGLPAGKVA